MRVQAMFKQVLSVALLLPGLALGAAPAASPPAGAVTPQAQHQTSRSSARKQMAACQKKAAGLTGAAKQTAIQNCMRGG
jgi:hypothetical protein